MRDLLSFESTWYTAYTTYPPRPVVKLFDFITKRLGVTIGYTADSFLLADPRYVRVMRILERMQQRGMVLECYMPPLLTDEPPIKMWQVRFREGDESKSGGTAPTDDVLALTIALAEAQERYIWFHSTDYYRNPRVATVDHMLSRYNTIDPARFAGLSQEQRARNPRFHISPTSSFKWIQGYSYVQQRHVYVPARTASPHQEAVTQDEPFIRKLISTGLATYPERTEALLRGALEVIERDAYMISWLNQLTLPRIQVDELAHDAELAFLMASCDRYRLQVHLIPLLTDAPAHVIMAVIEDPLKHQPPFAFGLKAHRSLSAAARGAIMEALRARSGTRRRLSMPDRPPLPKTIGHFDRLDYWAQGDNYKKLAFLIEGPVQAPQIAPWETDSVEAHWQRILTWCTTRGYECLSVPLTPSRANVTDWHIEMVIIPELQPIHYHEGLPHIGGTRLQEIPTQYGYRARDPFVTEPHPFA